MKKGGRRDNSGRMKRYGDEQVKRVTVRLPASVLKKIKAMKGRKMVRTDERGEEMRVKTDSDAIVDVFDRRK